MSGEFAELGIAKTAAKASELRLSGKDGLQCEQASGERFFNERITAYVMLLCLFMFLFVWLVTVPFAVRAAVTLATFLVGVAIIIQAHRRRRQIAASRDRQVAAHSRRHGN